jgi:hypothetical protein
MKIGLSSSQATRMFAVDEHNRILCVPAELLRPASSYKEREVRRSHSARCSHTYQTFWRCTRRFQTGRVRPIVAC